MGDMEMRLAPASLTASERPNDPPMTKETVLVPPVIKDVYKRQHAGRGNQRNDRRAQTAQGTLNHRQIAVLVVQKRQQQNNDTGRKHTANGCDRCTAYPCLLYTS